MRAVADVLKAAAATGGTVSLTGHSLGGGLAGIAAVLFDLPAKAGLRARKRRFTRVSSRIRSHKRPIPRQSENGRLDVQMRVQKLYAIGTWSE